MLLSAQWAFNGISGTSYIGWIFFSEFLGSMLLIMLGNGVGALANLKGSKGKGAGWTAIALGWGLAVFIGAISSQYSGAHLNFAVSIGILIESVTNASGAKNVFADGHQWLIVIYLAAQFAGMFVGQLIVDGVYWLQIKEQDGGDFLCFHSTSPANKTRSPKTYAFNVFAEFAGTFVLIIAVTAGSFYINKAGIARGSFGLQANGLAGAGIAALGVAAIGYGLGGPTGFALNPTRDFAPRLVYAILPLPNKQKADWAYSWVPIVGPILGGVVGGAVSLALMA